MNIVDFYTKYNGKKVDADGIYPGECVDLIKIYFAEVLGIPAVRGNAIDYWRDIPGFKRITKTIFNYPQPDDIIIWNKTATNPYGHIGICAWVRTFDFSCFEQNFPTGSPCHFQDHNYKGVLGWLRPLNKPKESPVSPKTAPWRVPVTVVGTPIPSLASEVLKWSSGDIILGIKNVPMDIPYDPQKEYNVLVRDRFCIISCNPPPSIYKTTMTDDRQTVYAIAGPDAVTASYEVSHMLHKYYLAHRGANPYFDIVDTIGNVSDQERYQKYNVLKPYMDSVILKP